MTDKKKLVSVSFLNAKPLVYNLEKYDNINISYEIPSKCSEILRNKEAHCGLIPVIEYSKDYLIIPEICIAAEKKAASVLLLGNKPLEEMKTVSLDPASRTSAALLLILFHSKYGIEPDFYPPEEKTDGKLLIGDKALEECNKYKFAYDLAEEWEQWQNLPFVFAFWAGWKETITGDLVVSLLTTRNVGIRNIDKIAEQWAVNNRETPGFYSHYLSENLNYFLDDRKQDAIKLFYKLAQEQGIIEEIPELVFY